MCLTATLQVGATALHRLKLAHSDYALGHGLSANDLYEEQLTVWQLANGPGFGGQVTITKSDMIEF